MVINVEKASAIISYMLRCCRDQSEGLLSVYLRQVQSGDEKYFSSLEDAMEFIKLQVTPDQER